MFPKYVENILKWFFGERRLVQIILYPYTGCDVHCDHCSDYEKFRNETMPLRLVKRLLSKAKWSWFQLVVVVVGTGEPLLSPKIVPLMEMLASSPLVNLVRITTSGFSEGESVKAERFNGIMRLQNLKKCAIYHSFNLYHETFPRRLKNAIEMMLECESRCILNVSMAVDNHNSHETLRGLEDVLRNLDIGEPYESFPIIIGKDIPDEYIREQQLHVIKFFKEGYDITSRLKLMPQCYAIKSETKKMFIKVIPFPVECFGRARKFKDKLLGNERCMTFVNDGEYLSQIYLGPDGECYADMNCFNIPHMSLGNIYRDKLPVLFRRKRKMAESLVAEILQYGKEGLSICEVHQDICRRKMK